MEIMDFKKQLKHLYEPSVKSLKSKACVTSRSGNEVAWVPQLNQSTSNSPIYCTKSSLLRSGATGMP